MRHSPDNDTARAGGEVAEIGGGERHAHGEHDDAEYGGLPHAADPAEQLGDEERAGGDADDKDGGVGGQQRAEAKQEVNH